VLDRLGAPGVTVTYEDGHVISDAERAAAAADVTVLMVGDVARETWDKNSNWSEENPGGRSAGAANEVPDLDLPSVQGVDQQALIPRILAANPNTVMVMKTEGQVNMPWIDDAHTLVQAWYPGQEDGNVVAEALFGITNFSGKLPITIGRTDREAAYETQQQYPGVLEDTGVPGGIGRDPQCEDPDDAPPCESSGPAPQRVVRYSEDLDMGYRWYEATGTAPLFPFGYGLSYTTFTYTDLAVTPVTGANGQPVLHVDYTVTNTGARAGMEASQVYLTLPPEAHEPSMRLVGFDKTPLAPGESRRVAVLIDSAASNHPFSYFQPADEDLANWANGEWKTPNGAYTVHVGGSSADTPLSSTVDLAFSQTPPGSTP
jgi:beta-glucosidase